MPNVIELAHFRGKTRAKRHVETTDGSITIEWQADGTHSYSIQGTYSRSFALTMQALTQVAAKVATEVVRHEFKP